MTSAFSNNGCAKMRSAYEWSVKPAEARSSFCNDCSWALHIYYIYAPAAVHRAFQCWQTFKYFFSSSVKTRKLGGRRDWSGGCRHAAAFETLQDLGGHLTWAVKPTQLSYPATLVSQPPFYPPAPLQGTVIHNHVTKNPDLWKLKKDQGDRSWPSSTVWKGRVFSEGKDPQHTLFCRKM